MLTGYNTDIRHEGVVYHVQTEDSGVDNPVIVSLVYQGGRILASRKTSYAQILSTENLVPKIRDLLEKQHRAMIRAVLTGTLNTTAKSGPEPKTEPVLSEPAAHPPQAAAGLQAATLHPQPPAETGPAPAQAPASATEKNLDQVILEYLASEMDND